MKSVVEWGVHTLLEFVIVSKYFLFLYFVSRLIASNPGLTFHHQLSLPSVRQPVQRVVIPDSFGIDRSYAVNTQTLQSVRSIISAPGTNVIGGPAPVQPTFQQLAGTSQFSSQSSLGSNISQAAGYNVPPSRSVLKQ